MKSLWLRLYTEVLNDPKVQELEPMVFKTWVNLLCIAKEHDRQGSLPPLSHLCFALRKESRYVANDLSRLVSAGLVDRSQNGVYEMHGWSNRQYSIDDDPSNAARQRRYREKHHKGNNAPSNAQNNVTDNIIITVLETETETETETENTNTWSPSAPAPENTEPKPKRSIHPTLDEVKAYCSLRGNAIDPEQWYSYYQANGWKVGRNPMKDWQAAVRTWEKNGVGPPRKPQQTPEQTAARKEALQILEDFRRSKR